MLHDAAKGIKGLPLPDAMRFSGGVMQRALRL
jgi:hypothetical protein